MKFVQGSKMMCYLWPTFLEKLSVFFFLFLLYVVYTIEMKKWSETINSGKEKKSRQNETLTKRKEKKNPYGITNVYAWQKVETNNVRKKSSKFISTPSGNDIDTLYSPINIEKVTLNHCLPLPAALSHFLLIKISQKNTAHSNKRNYRVRTKHFLSSFILINGLSLFLSWENDRSFMQTHTIHRFVC